MRVIYRPETAQTWASLLNQQAMQSGHGMPGFVGARYQRGAGFGSLFSGLLRTVLPLAKTAGKAIGREALRTGASVASDVLAGQDFGSSLKTHSKASAGRLLKKANNHVSGKSKKRRRQRGHGLGFRRQVRAGVRVGTKRQKSKRRVSCRKRVCRDQLGVYVS